MLRLFDKNYDGYIDKKEFRWMTSSERFSKKTIDIVFEVTICELAGQEARAMLNYFDWIDNNSLTIRVTKVPDGTFLGPTVYIVFYFSVVIWTVMESLTIKNLKQ